jgi:hypothetical protein
MIACRRWSASASSIDLGESVNTACCRQTGNSSPWAFVATWSGVASLTRRRINRAVTVGLCLRKQQRETDLGDLCVRYPLLELLIEHRVRIPNSGLPVVGDRADRGGDGAVLSAGDRELGPGSLTLPADSPRGRR